MIIIYPVKSDMSLTLKALTKSLFGDALRKIRPEVALLLASVLVEHGLGSARAGRWCGVPVATCRKKVPGRSGRAPAIGVVWVETSPINRLHATAFLRAWQTASDLPRPLRLLDAWLEYKQAAPQPTPTGASWGLDRAAVLVETWERRKEYGVRWAACRKCGGHGLALSHEVRYTCPECNGSITVSLRLRGKSGRKSTQGV